jgi:F-type H+-transporting ATPase subunit delta
MLDAEQNVVRAVVTTAVPLLKPQRERLAQKLCGLTGAARVEIETKVSKAVVAGVVIRIGDHVIDGSARGALETLRERLKQVRVAGLATGGGD